MRHYVSPNSFLFYFRYTCGHVACDKIKRKQLNDYANVFHLLVYALVVMMLYSDYVLVYDVLLVITCIFTKIMHYVCISLYVCDSMRYVYVMFAFGQQLCCNLMHPLWNFCARIKFLDNFILSVLHI